MRTDIERIMQATEMIEKYQTALRRIRAIASDALTLSGDADSIAECDAEDFRAILSEIRKAGL